MTQSLHSVCVLVRDHDAAIDFFTQVLRLVLLEDTQGVSGKRRVRVGPAASGGASLVLALASTPEQQACVGRQAGDRVFLYLHSSDFAGDHRHMLARGVQFLESPRVESYGTVAVFLDLYGNKWDLLQPRTGHDTA